MVWILVVLNIRPGSPVFVPAPVTRSITYLLLRKMPGKYSTPAYLIVRILAMGGGECA